MKKNTLPFSSTNESSKQTPVSFRDSVLQCLPDTQRSIIKMLPASSSSVNITLMNYLCLLCYHTPIDQSL